MQTPNYGGMLHYGGILPSELPGTYLITHAGEILLLMQEKCLATRWRIHGEETYLRKTSKLFWGTHLQDQNPLVMNKSFFSSFWIRDHSCSFAILTTFYEGFNTCPVFYHKKGYFTHDVGRVVNFLLEWTCSPCVSGREMEKMGNVNCAGCAGPKFGR